MLKALTTLSSSLIFIAALGQYQVGVPVSDTLTTESYTTVEGCLPSYDIVLTVDPEADFFNELPDGLSLHIVIEELIPQDGAPSADIGLQDNTILEVGMTLPLDPVNYYYELTFFSAQTVGFSYVLEGTPTFANHAYWCHYEFVGQPFPCENLAFISGFEDDTCYVQDANSAIELGSEPLHFSLYPQSKC